MRPRFGSQLHELIFAPITIQTMSQARRYVDDPGVAVTYTGQGRLALTGTVEDAAVRQKIRRLSEDLHPSVLVLGGAGKSGSLTLAAARAAGARRTTGVVPIPSEARALETAGITDDVVVADARDPVGLSAAVRELADITVVCVDVPGCEGGAILATAEGGTVVFFSMATSFSAAALGAEGLGADVTLLIGNGYARGHAELALDLVRTQPGVRRLIEDRISGH